MLHTQSLVCSLKSAYSPTQSLHTIMEIIHRRLVNINICIWASSPCVILIHVTLLQEPVRYVLTHQAISVDLLFTIFDVLYVFVLKSV